jgi:Patatin-like phospholipase
MAMNRDEAAASLCAQSVTVSPSALIQTCLKISTRLLMPDTFVYAVLVQRRPIRVLSIDGGGVRGMVPLAVLHLLLVKVQHIDGCGGLQPCDLFDVIIGTSTGGILAVLLGVLRLPVSQCVDIYKELSKKAFAPCVEAHFPGASVINGVLLLVIVQLRQVLDTAPMNLRNY